jgi:alcohol dehydrogenase class IV
VVLQQSPVVFGEGSLSYLENVRGRRACIVTDANLVRMGFANRIREQLMRNDLEVDIYDAIEPDPTIATVRRGATFLNGYWTGLDRCPGRRFGHRRGQGDVGAVRISRH